MLIALASVGRVCCRTGTGRVNAAGLDFYKRLVDELVANDIQPMATLYHWDLPQAMEDRGGWANPDSAKWFAEYADVMFRALDDRVPLWATLNEPWVVVHEGYVDGWACAGAARLARSGCGVEELAEGARGGGRGVSGTRQTSRSGWW